MKIVSTSWKTQSFSYDFNIDGGLQGSYNTGIFIPANAGYYLVAVNVSNALIGNPGATVNVGYLGNLSFLYSNFTPIPIGFFPPVLPSKSLGLEILFTIGIADLTSGAAIFTIVYIEYPF